MQPSKVSACEGSRWLRSLPPSPEFLQNQGETRPLKGFSIFAGNRVWTYLTHIEKHTCSIHSTWMLKTGCGLKHLLTQHWGGSEVQSHSQSLIEFEASLGSLGTLSKTNKAQTQAEVWERRKERKAGDRTWSPHDGKYHTALPLLLPLTFPACGEQAYSHFTNGGAVSERTPVICWTHKARECWLEQDWGPQSSWSPWFTEGGCVVLICTQ